MDISVLSIRKIFGCLLFKQTVNETNSYENTNLPLDPRDCNDHEVP